MNLCKLLIISLLVGCSTNKAPPLPPAPVTKTVYLYPDCTVPKRMVVKLRDIEWKIIPDLTGQMVFSLTPLMYADAGYNTSMLILAVKELKAEINQYVKCLTPPVD